MTRDTVAVVGAGLIGLASAYFLQKAGLSVVVLERSRIGAGASRFNAGMITSSASPLPAPGVLRSSARTIFRSDSALFLSFRQSPAAARYFLRFARYCSASAYERGEAALADLNAYSLELFRDLRATGLVPGVRDSGYMVCCAGFVAAQTAHHHYESLPRLVAPPGPLLEGEAVTAVEPSVTARVAAAFVRPNELWCDPSPVVDALAKTLRDGGCHIVEGARVTSIRDTPSGVEIHSSSGTYQAMAAVIAAGIWSEELCRAAGSRLGMQPGKGYSFSVQPKVMPQRVLYFTEASVVATPIGQRLRLAGTMEFDGTRDRFNRGRIQAMTTAVKPFLQGVDWSDLSNEWVAPRPMTADGLPLIGPLPRSRHIFVATGHNMLGLTLGTATGKVVADMVTGRNPKLDLTPFAVGRFS